MLRGMSKCEMTRRRCSSGEVVDLVDIRFLRLASTTVHMGLTRQHECQPDQGISIRVVPLANSAQANRDQPTTRDWNSRTGMDVVAPDVSGSVPAWPNACHDTTQSAVAVIV